MWLMAPVFAADIEFVTACKGAGVHILAAPNACGANTPEGIAMDTFMLQAAAIPIVIPEYALERRKRVLGK
jgi:hypothetical protein